MFKKYRIIEINGKFIPQIRKNLFCWYGIDKDNFETWINIELQIEYCSQDTIEYAKEAIKEYVKSNTKSKYSITYHYL